MIFHRFSSWELWRYRVAWQKPSRLEQHIVSKHLIFCLPAVHSSTCHHFLLYYERFQKLLTQRTIKSSQYKTDHSNFLNSDLVLHAEIWLKVYQTQLTLLVCVRFIPSVYQITRYPSPPQDAWGSRSTIRVHGIHFISCRRTTYKLSINPWHGHRKGEKLLHWIQNSIFLEENKTAKKSAKN